MREHDQPRLHTRHCVWIGLIIAVAVRRRTQCPGRRGRGARGACSGGSDRTVRPPRPVLGWAGRALGRAFGRGRRASGSRGPAPPRCRRPDRRRFARRHQDLSGRSLRRGRRPAHGARISRRRRSHREVLATRKGVKLSSYKEDGTERLPSPPVGLKILERSGLAVRAGGRSERGQSTRGPGGRGGVRLAALAGSGAGPRFPAGAGAIPNSKPAAVRSPGPAAGPRAGAGRRRNPQACTGARAGRRPAQDRPAADRGRAGRRGAEPQ